MLKYLKVNNLQSCIVILLGLIAAFFSIFQGIMLQIIIDTAVGNLSWEFKKIFLLVLVYVFFYWIITRMYKGNLYSVVTKSIKQIKNAMISSVLDKDKDIKTENFMEFVSVIEKDTTQVFEKYLINFFLLIHMSILFCMSMIYLLFINKTLTALVVISGAISVFLPQVFIAKARKVNENYLNINKNFFYQIKELMSGLSVIKIFGLEQEMRNRVQYANEELEHAHKEQLYQQSIIEGLSNSIGFLALACNVVFAGYLSYRGYFTIGTVLAIMQIMNFIMMPLVQIPIIIMQMKSIQPAINNINAYIESPVSIKLESPQALDNIEVVKLSNIYYKIPKQNHYILKNINLEFEKGKKYAIVGESGSGKSTLLKVVANFTNEYEGKIIINSEKCLKEYLIVEWRKAIAFIEQKVFLFNDTIEYNICFEENYSVAEMDVLLDKVGLISFKEERMSGIQRKVGENGENLSGGEKQRVAIARSFYKDASIFLADEPTSGLDSTSSYLIEKLLLDSKKMVLHVTHKLGKELLQRYDKVICMQNGEIVGIGTFSELITSNEYFQKLCSDYKCESQN